MPWIQILLKALPALALFWPEGPGWLVPFLGKMVKVSKDLVEELGTDHYKGMPGRKKLRFVVEGVAEGLDDSFDDVPEWTNLPEAKRDRILEGLAEFILFMDRATRKKRKNRSPALVKLRNKLRPNRKPDPLESGRLVGNRWGEDVEPPPNLITDPDTRQ